MKKTILKNKNNREAIKIAERCLLVVLFVFMCSFKSITQIGPVVADGWKPIGNSRIDVVFSDGDNGDGVGDGARRSVGNVNGKGFGMLYEFRGTMQENENLELKTYVYNPNNSYVSFIVELYNLTDDKVLVKSKNTLLAKIGDVVEIVLNYVPVASDSGDVLQLRYIRTDDGNSVRAFSVDNAKLNGNYLYPESGPAKSCYEQTGNERGWLPMGDSTTLRNVITDGIGDGALSITSSSSEVGSGAKYAFDCLMPADQLLKAEALVYNPNSSYVTLRLQLYNATDNRVLSNVSVTVNAGEVRKVNVVYYTKSDDLNDKLELQLFRIDDGNPARSFAIDYATINGTKLNLKIILPPLKPICALGVTAIPDIALENVTEKQVEEVKRMYMTLSNAYLGSGPASGWRNQFEEANKKYDALKIQIDGREVSGERTSFASAGSILVQFVKYLKFIDSSDLVVAQKVNNLVALVCQQFCRGIIPSDGNGYVFRNFSRPVMYAKDYISDDVKDQFGYVLSVHCDNFRLFWGDYRKGQGFSTDLMYNFADQMFIYGIWRYPNDNREMVRHMKGAKRFLERFFDYTDGTGGGIKPDGSGFHHAAAYSGYMYAFGESVNLVSVMNDTSFQISADHYKVIKNAIYAEKMMSNDAGIRALSMSGRNPHGRTVSNGQSTVAKLAISGGKILGLSTADPVLAGYYNRVWGVNPQFNYSAVVPFEQGFVQLNHANSGVFRNENWVVVFKGFGDNLWGSEIYDGANHFGRYQSYGAVEILYPGGLGANGYNVSTWNWNYNPGTTTIVLPWGKLLAEKIRIDELQEKRFAGALTFKNKGGVLDVLQQNYGTWGMFAMNFREREGLGWGGTRGPNTHNKTFTFKKSNFAFEDFIVCLGSDISNNDNENSTVTTLYQRMDKSEGSITVNDIQYNGEGEVNFEEGKGNWLINKYNTGFYIAKGDVKIWKGSQQVPAQNETKEEEYADNPFGDYIRGYIDHGKAPNNKSYEYLLKPNASPEFMRLIAGEKPYEVIEISNQRHIVKHKKSNIWGYAFWEPAQDLMTGLIKSNDKACLVMIRIPTPIQSDILLSVTDPELGFKNLESNPAKPSDVTLVLDGEWLLKNTCITNAVIIASTEISTTIQFHIVDAMPVEIELMPAEILDRPQFNNPSDAIVVYPQPSLDKEFYLRGQFEMTAAELFDITGKKIPIQVSKVSSGYKVEMRGKISNSIFILKFKANGKVVSKKITFK